MTKFLIIGNGAREAIFAKKLALDSVVYAIVGHENPTIISAVKETGGELLVADINDGDLVVNFAKDCNIDYVFVNSDNPLANGVVDRLLENNIKAIGPTKAGSRIEWDKIYSINVVNQITPQFTPLYQVVNDVSEIEKAIDYFSGKDIVVKPQGLTGGKGVKVMGEHLKSYEDVAQYSKSLLESGSDVLLTEKLSGFEFTIMAITDGDDIKFAPATYDYPYRFENDTGPGTGGMGCFTVPSNNLPFMSKDDFANCCEIMRLAVKFFKDNDIHYNGVLNGGFFLTNKGIKFMEFNARFGDPEGVNILSLLDGSFSELLKAIYAKKLADFDLKFLPKASVVKYLVSKEYPAKGDRVSFKININDIESRGVDTYFSAAKLVDNDQNDFFETVSSSRVLALSYIADDVVEASTKLNQIIDSITSDVNLDYRPDIANAVEIKRLTRAA